MRVPILLIFLLTVPAFAASADFYDGLRVYDAGRYSEAVRLWKQSAGTGDARSQLRLAALFEDGRGIPQNYVRAHLYYNLAAAQGSAPARRARNRLARRMTKTDLAQAQHLAAAWRPGLVPRSKIPQTALLTPGTGAAGLKSLFTGARVNMARSVNIGMLNIVADFKADGSITGGATHDEGSDAGVGVRINGTWWVKGGKLCTKFAPIGFLKSDPPAGSCYTISGSGKQYSASGSDGLLMGSFRLDK